MRVVLTGGGTGGHVYPAVSVGQAFRHTDPRVELLFIGSSHGPEGELARKVGIPFKAVPSSSLTKALSLKNAVSFGRLIAGVPRARRMLKEFQPDVVIGTGGYTTAAVLIAARSLGLRTMIHEQNAVPGRTNLMLARVADRVCVTFESSASCFPSAKVVVTGMPIREEFSSLRPKPDARRALGLREDAFTIFVIGGSQGARRINELMLDAWPTIDDGSTQVLHQAGERNIADVAPRAEALGAAYRAEAYVDTTLAMPSADLVICRSGASTLSEMTAAGLPSIQIPYPFSYADHQKRNAEYLAMHGAAVLCEEASCTASILAEMVRDLRAKPEKLQAMAAASASLGMPDAAKKVVEVAHQLLQ